MPSSPKELGTRERRKLRLQSVIRREAFKLFAKQGYDRTTVEQIADAADISYSTFFRHFPSKDAIALDMRFDSLFIEALEAQPTEKTLPDALRDANNQAIAALSQEDLATLREHYALLLQIPPLQASAFHGLNASAQNIGTIIANRLQKDPATLDIQTYAWSLVGGWIAAFHYWIEHRESNLGDTLGKTISLLDSTAMRLEGVA